MRIGRIATLGAIFLMMSCLGGRAFAQEAPMTLDELKALASQGPSGVLNYQLKKSWATLCETYSPEELTKQLTPLARKFAKPPLTVMQGAPLDAREFPKDTPPRFRGWEQVSALVTAFAAGDCVTENRKFIEAYYRDVTYGQGPAIYTHLQYDHYVENMLYWHDWVNRQAPVDTETNQSDRDRFNQVLFNLSMSLLVDQLQPIPLFKKYTEEEFQQLLYRPLERHDRASSHWYNYQKTLAAIFAKGPEEFLRVADDIHHGKIILNHPDSAEFYWVKLAFEASTFHTEDSKIYLSETAVERVSDALLNGRMRSSRIQEGIDVDMAAEHALAYDLIVEMAQEGHLFAYRQAYCALSADHAFASTDDGQSLRLRLLETLKQADEPYNERDYERLKDRVSLFSAWGAKLGALWGGVPFTREDFKAEDIDTSVCTRRMSADS